MPVGVLLIFSVFPCHRINSPAEVRVPRLHFSPGLQPRHELIQRSLGSKAGHAPKPTPPPQISLNCCFASSPLLYASPSTLVYVSVDHFWSGLSRCTYNIHKEQDVHKIDHCSEIVLTAVTCLYTHISLLAQSKSPSTMCETKARKIKRINIHRAGYVSVPQTSPKLVEDAMSWPCNTAKCACSREHYPKGRPVTQKQCLCNTYPCSGQSAIQSNMRISMAVHIK